MGGLTTTVGVRNRSPDVYPDETGDDCMYILQILDFCSGEVGSGGDELRLARLITGPLVGWD